MNRHPWRRAALTVALVVIGVPMMTMPHLYCLGVAPESPLYEPPIDRIEGGGMTMAAFPQPGETDAPLGYPLRLLVWRGTTESWEVALRDITGGSEGIPVPVTVVELDNPDPIDHIVVQPEEPLEAFHAYRVDAVICSRDPYDSLGTCQATTWSFETRDLGLPLDEGSDPGAVGFALDATAAKMWHPYGLSFWIEPVLAQVGTLLLTSAPEGDLSTTWVTLGDPDTEPVEQDPCMVTYELPGVWTEVPPEASFGPLDIPVSAGPYQGTVWSLGGTILVAPDASRALVNGLRAAVDTRLYDQHMIEGGATTCDFSICDARQPDPFRAASLRLLAEAYRGDPPRRADDWYLGYSCEMLPMLGGGECVECPDGSGPWCLDVEFAPAWAYAIDQPVQPRSVEDVLGDPAC